MSGLRDKASRINFSGLPTAAPHTADVSPTQSVESRRPKTAPGLLMAQAVDQRSEIVKANASLTEEVAQLKQEAETAKAAAESLEQRLRDVMHDFSQWDGAKATRLLATELVVRSRWANRDERHFATADFEELRDEIGDAGGNVQPIKVRPVVVDGVAKFEIVFGHRRFEACRQLGLPVLALIDSVDEQGLFVEMDRENRLRQNLSAWEQGVMYLRALESGLWPSSRKMAETLGVDLTNLGRALALAKLPGELIQAFPTPFDLQYRWAAPLSSAYKQRPEEVLTVARRLSALETKPTAKEVFAALVESARGGSTVLPHPVQRAERDITVSGRAVGRVARVSGAVEISVSLPPELTADIDLSAMCASIEQAVRALLHETPKT